MVIRNTSTCPNCGGSLKYYDSVPRIVREKRRLSNYIKVRRLRCPNCKSIYREIPDSVYPYKQYYSEIINGVLEGFITSDTIGFEDYPCEDTMKRWKTTSRLRKEFNEDFRIEISEEFIFSES